MRGSTRITYTWQGAAERLERLAAGNARADQAWLRSLSIGESIAIFEDLCRGIPELSITPELDPPPVALWRIWRR
jgi:hypothetical protein